MPTSSGKFTVGKFGANPAVASAAYEGIWDLGGTFNWLTAAEPVRVKAGGNAADTAAGAGAQAIMVQGLDANFDLAEAPLETAGASAGPSSTVELIRVFRIFVIRCGTYTVGAPQNNVGDIIVEGATSGTELGSLIAGAGQSLIGQYTVPRGYTAFLKRFSLLADSANGASFQLFKRENADDTDTPFSGARLQRTFAEISGVHEEVLSVPIILAEKTDVWWQAKAVAGVMSCEATLDLELYRNAG